MYDDLPLATPFIGVEALGLYKIIVYCRFGLQSVCSHFWMNISFDIYLQEEFRNGMIQAGQKIPVMPQMFTDISNH